MPATPDSRPGSAWARLAATSAAHLMAAADQRCPYSNATRGNIQVILTVDGTPIDEIVENDQGVA